MIISYGLENDIKEAIKKIKEDHRINGSVLIVMNNETTYVVSETKKENKSYMFGYGIGYNAGRNDHYDTIYGKGLLKNSKSTNNRKNYQ